jgi:hypothetical protein
VVASLILTGALVARAPAGGAPSADTAGDPCAGSFRTLANYRDAFAAVARFGTGWTTADGYVPVALPDGRTAWLMSDTLLGPPAANGDPPTLVHNSIVVQRGRCLTAVLGGTVDARTDLVAGLDGRWCWPSSGVARGHTLLVFCTMVEAADGPPGFAFRVAGSAVATFDLPTLDFRVMRALPFPEPASVRWGTGAVLDHRTLFVYGASPGAAYVARVPFGHATTGPWTFWTGRGWGPRDEVTAMTFAGGSPSGPPFVTASGSAYVAVAFPHALPDRAIVGWTAHRPQGPWRSRGTLTTASVTGTQFAYDARAARLGPAGWVVIYNVNDPVAVTVDPARYGGRFVAPRRGQGATNWWSAG